jgi:hypothetical protein
VGVKGELVEKVSKAKKKKLGGGRGENKVPTKNQKQNPNFKHLAILF